MRPIKSGSKSPANNFQEFSSDSPERTEASEPLLDRVGGAGGFPVGISDAHCVWRMVFYGVYKAILMEMDGRGGICDDLCGQLSW